MGRAVLAEPIDLLQSGPACIPVRNYIDQSQGFACLRSQPSLPKHSASKSAQSPLQPLLLSPLCCRALLSSTSLSDFYQGWLYVLAVGIAAGTIEKEANSQREAAVPI